MRSGSLDFRRPFGHAAEEGAIVQFLEGVAVLDVRRSTWPTNRIMGVESCWAIWMPAEALVAPGPRVTKQMPGRPVGLAIGFRHHRGAAFIAADRDLDAAVVKRVQHREIGFAGHAEDMADALGDQLFDQHLRGGAMLAGFGKPDAGSFEDGFFGIGEIVEAGGWGPLYSAAPCPGR